MSLAQVNTVKRLRRYAEEYGLEVKGAGFHNGLPYVDFRDPTKRPSELGAAMRALVLPNGSVHGPSRLVEANSIMLERDAESGR